MKITLESVQLPETEIIIRGNVTSEEVISILQLLRSKTSGKVVAYRDEEQFILNAGEIIYAETGGSGVIVHTSKETYETRQKLFELKDQLCAQGFAQINKSTIVNINAVKSIQAEFSGNYRVKLKATKDVLTVSRKYFREFRDRI
ncbi:MAG: LytTR family transcriptional regulator DNA-binding domain-containing protein [Oscillospiraceae bacterium]|nr:LytTR family transcriptional regulator DNA-binding domain-containing protein [Oscillospiraceae bacterium]